MFCQLLFIVPEADEKLNLLLALQAIYETVESMPEIKAQFERTLNTLHKIFSGKFFRNWNED